MTRSITVSLCLVLSVVSAVAQTFPASEASKHVGEQATVCGQIADVHTAENSKGKPTFVDLDQAFPHQAFTVVIWESEKGKVGNFPTAGNVCVTGPISSYRGVAQIILHDAKSWSVNSKPAVQ